MEPRVSDILSYKDTALEIWQRAEKLYGHKKNYTHIYQIQREMQQAKQQGQPAMNLFGFLQKKKKMKLGFIDLVPLILLKSKNEKNMMRFSNFLLALTQHIRQ
jgi:hypothetical protein